MSKQVGKNKQTWLADEAGELVIGNDLRVARLGFGAMRLTGKGIWGRPRIAPTRLRCFVVLWNSELTSSILPIPMAPMSRKN